MRSSLLRLVVTSMLALGVASCTRTDLFVDQPDAGSDASVVPEADAGPPPIKTANKLDLLLVIDNTSNLELAQDLLGKTVPYLLKRLANPPCVNGLGNVVATPAEASDPCPVGERDFPAIADFHVGVITTSLGGHGADLCSPGSPGWNSTQNDAAHLLQRSAGGGFVPTYQNKGFLAWDPTQKDIPPGENDLGAVETKVVELVGGAGNAGCGLESQLESIYRFLIDPNPYATITLDKGIATPMGTDAALLQQRNDFLRPDSAVAVLLLTDENDCSIREGSQYYLAAQQAGTMGQYHLPRARSECITDPDSQCCASCQMPTPSGCPPTAEDPTCNLPSYTNFEDPINLRCFDQKRRFGIDFLYPVDRYVQGFTSATVADRAGNLVDNPLFVSGRVPALVTFGAVLGVPWQDVAVDPKAISVGLKPGQEIDWGLIVGDPASKTPPGDPLMFESIDPRTGVNPPTGTALAPPTSLIELANPINGHERNIATRDDLQYVCIYQRPFPKDCNLDNSDCECVGMNIATNPICQQPDGSYSSVQRAQRALPGVRELRVLSQLGPQAVVGSVCAPNTDNQSISTFAYKPAVDALMHAIRLNIVH